MYQQQFHTSSYRGNEQGHDASLRADSQRPSANNSSMAASQFSSQQRAFQPTGMVQSFYKGNQQQASGASASTAAYHAAGYRGNQQGHDQYLRADATSPSGMQARQGFAGFSSMTAQAGFAAGQASGQAASQQSFHTASYHGNQQGHDQSIRSDASSPSGMQFR